MRTAIFHVHLFKNAGTSVDAILKRNFKGGWVTREFGDARHAANNAAVARWVAEEQAAVAFSSHTAAMPLPAIEGVELLPIVFVRHPLDRIYSAYRFETEQQIDGFGAVLAKETSFAGYVRVRLSLGGDHAIQDFQARRIVGGRGFEAGRLAEAAIAAADALPFVGLVESFEESLDAMAAMIKPHFPDFAAVTAHANAGKGAGRSLDDRLTEIRELLGEDLYDRLAAENAADIALHAHVGAAYEHRARATAASA